MVAVLALRRLLPAGTLHARRGLPAGVAVRGLVAVAFLGCDAFMPLALIELRGSPLAAAGAVITVASLSWSIGAWVQSRFDRHDAGRGRGVRAMVGLAVLLSGLVLTGVGVLAESVPVAVGVVGWAVGGFGIGFAYPSVARRPLPGAAGRGGLVSAALRTAETVGVAASPGIGGALIAVGLDQAGTPRPRWRSCRGGRGDRGRGPRGRAAHNGGGLSATRSGPGSRLDVRRLTASGRGTAAIRTARPTAAARASAVPMTIFVASRGAVTTSARRSHGGADGPGRRGPGAARAAVDTAQVMLRRRGDRSARYARSRVGGGGRNRCAAASSAAVKLAAWCR